MALEQIYEQLGGDYQDVVARLMSETIVRRFLKRFLENNEYEELENAMVQGDDARAFRASHTLKGISLNLGMGNLVTEAVALTESLRDGRGEQTDQMYQNFQREYQKTIGILRQIEL